MPFSSRLFRYLALQVFIGVLIAGGVVSAIIILVDFIEQTRSIGARVEATAFDLLMLTLLKAPLLIEETLPFIFLFGVLFALFRLNRRSELVVMRASGYSAWRILNPAVLIALVFGLIATMALNPIGAALNSEFELRRQQLADVPTDAPRTNTVWMRDVRPDGFTVIASDALEENASQLSSPVFYEYSLGGDGVPRLERRLSASEAVLQAGFWSLPDAVERIPGQEPVELGTISIPTGIERQSLFERARSPNGVSFWDLPPLIESAETSGLAVERYQLRWYTLLALPITLIAASLIAGAATLRLYRLGGAATFALTGGAAGFAVYFVQELLGSLGSTSTLPPITAAWAAPAITTLLALAYISATEDG